MDKRESQKREAARAALSFLQPDIALGVGTGSTANFFIELLGETKMKFRAIVASSTATEKLLSEAGWKVSPLPQAGEVDVYVDGADEADPHGRLIKGGGGAHAREKILAHAARLFVCIVDEGKRVSRLGEKFAVPVETLPMARGLAARRLAGMGANVAWREEFTTDNGGCVLDARGLDLLDAPAVEDKINAIPGVVENGVFARRRADVLITAGDSGVEVLRLRD